MPTTIVSAIYGLVGGLVGAIVMGIIMMLMSDKLKTTPPKILAEKMLGSANKDKKLHFSVMSFWGIIYGLVVALTAYINTYQFGLLFSLLPWLVLGLIMLPMAGAGLFGSKKDGKMWISSLILHLVWGLSVWLSYQVLTTLLG